MFSQLIPERFVPLCNIKKNPAKQDSPPAAGRASDILPFRRSAIRAEHLLSYGNEVSYTIKIPHPPPKQHNAAAAGTWDYIRYLICNCSEQVEALAAETVRI